MEREQGLFLLFESGDHLSNGITSLLHFTNRFPDSILAGYADAVLGKTYSIDFSDFHKGEVRKANFEKAIFHLRRAKDKEIGIYHQKLLILHWQMHLEDLITLAQQRKLLMNL